MSCNSMGKTVLLAAVERGHTSVVQLLLSSNVPLPSSSILPFALRQRSPPQLVQLLIHNGADVHSVSTEGETIFHLAVANYNESACRNLMKYFIEAGGNTNVCNSMGETVLHAATKRSYTSVVQLLLSHNAPLPSRILPFALQQCLPPHIGPLLIRKGADVHSTSSEGETVFHLAIANYNESACRQLVKCFMEAGGNTNVRNYMGKTVLQAAIERAYLSVIKLLLSQDDQLRRAILPFALQKRLPPRHIRDLVRIGADVHSTSSRGETVFHLAIANYNESVCRKLVMIFIDAGGNAVACDSEGTSALDSAIERRYDSVFNFLLKSAKLSKDEFSLLLATTQFDEPTCRSLVKSFVKANRDTDICNSTGRTVLRAAIKRGFTSVVGLLLSLNLPLPGRILPFALQHCLFPRLVRLLIRNGADVHSTSPEGETVFHLAVSSYNESVCLALVEDFIAAGGNPNICNSVGKSVLHAALERGYASVVVALRPCDFLPLDVLLHSPPPFCRHVVGGVDALQICQATPWEGDTLKSRVGVRVALRLKPVNLTLLFIPLLALLFWQCYR